jgi:ACR3 family arsenite efflux pump ArsB
LETKEEHGKKELSLGLWEKYLTLWIALCIVAGLMIGPNYKRLPSLSNGGEMVNNFLNKQISDTSNFVA